VLWHSGGPDVTGCAVLMSEIAMGLNIHHRSEYGKPCAMKVACTVWSKGKARALPIATINNKIL